jgi:hypothetical protein
MLLQAKALRQPGKFEKSLYQRPEGRCPAGLKILTPSM